MKPLTILRNAALIIFCVSLVNCQSSAATKATSVSTNSKTAISEKSEFPQWVRDLRRAEIVAFGIFPFAMFVSTFSVDTIRYFNHNQNLQYAPWPFKSAGAVEMTTDEHKLVLGAAIIGSVTLALTDFLIVLIKRITAERRRQALPEGEVIELRKPWPPDEVTEETETETESEDTGAGTP
ncbi:hypothetical protein AGMMS49944_31750 [Spirochaetia bacterium]|nr:hypothetical protein AGMMS49944_31750 [Spirochaetia bacterium]